MVQFVMLGVFMFLALAVIVLTAASDQADPVRTRKSNSAGENASQDQDQSAA